MATVDKTGTATIEELLVSSLATAEASSKASHREKINYSDRVPGETVDGEGHLSSALQAKVRQYLRFPAKHIHQLLLCGGIVLRLSLCLCSSIFKPVFLL
jgi:hypothetical protein